LVIQTNKAKTNPIKAKTKPKQTQFDERAKLMQSEHLQPIMKKSADRGYEKTNPIFTPFSRMPCIIRGQTQSKPISERQRNAY